MVIRQSKHFNLQRDLRFGAVLSDGESIGELLQGDCIWQISGNLAGGRAMYIFLHTARVEEIWNDYFDLETDYQSYIEGINQMILLARGGRVGEWDTDSPAGFVGDDSIISDFPAEPYHENPEVYSKSV